MRLSKGEIENVHALFQFGAMGTWTDGQLVAQFLSGREGGETAFRVVLQRHGPMVLGVCRRVLGDSHAAEDAFQATFLVFVKKASSLRDRDLLTNWLYGVALRVASKAKAEAARRQVIEKRAAGQEAGPGVNSDHAELRLVIDEEIRRLPERFRVPLVLCYMEGLHHHEIAQQLGCPVGTIESRLSRARDRLRSRLALRGVGTAGAAILAVLTPSSASAATPALIEATVRAAVWLRAGQGGAEAISATASVLAQQVVGPAMLPKVSVPLSILVACVGLTAFSVGTFRAEGTPARRLNQPPPSQPKPKTDVALAPAPIPPPPVDQPSEEPKTPIRPQRRSVATAVPVSNITIDGRLDDWPTNLTRYPIRNRIVGGAYGQGNANESPEDVAYFLVGYNEKAGLVYLAVVVPDTDVVAVAGDPWHTDAVEVYVDGTFSAREVASPIGDWKSGLKASTMPALQYVVLPGDVPAYSDSNGANPSLVYGNIAKTATTVKIHRTANMATTTGVHHEENILTYEWAIQAFDRYPDKPTRLSPGKSLGFDVAVVDKDHPKTAPTWTCWGPVPRIFKGIAASELGQLILGETP